MFRGALSARRKETNVQAIAEILKQTVTESQKLASTACQNTEPMMLRDEQKVDPSDNLCPTCRGALWVYAKSKHIPNDKERLVRCPACTNWIAVTRLTEDEQQHTVDHLTDRSDDVRGEMMALRFLAKQMLNDPFGFLSIWGRKGGGKSLVLTALVAEFARRGRPAYYFNASEVVSMLNPGNDPGLGGDWKGDMDACKRKLKDAPVLAIDEVDKIKWTPWQIQQIGEVIEHRHRYANCRVTLIAMNKPPHEWSNAGDVEHIASRLGDGRFYRRWPDDKMKWLPLCANGKSELPGLFEVTLPDIRPILRRYAI